MSEQLKQHLLDKYGPPPEDITILCIGIVLQAGGCFRRVKWVDLDRTDAFTNQSELLPLKKGDRFEAMVTRRASDWKFLSISSVAIRPEINSAEAHALFDRLMTRDTTL